jgi:hypothetical protein
MKFLLALLAPFLLVAAGTDAPVVGSWDCTAADARGNQTQWSLVVKQDGGALSATLRSGDGYTLGLLDPKLEEGHFSFHFKINPTESIEVLLKLDGDYMEGRFAGTNSGVGTFKAARVSAVRAAGSWTGEWEVDPDGRRGTPHHMVLEQEGQKVTGTAGPSADRQIAIANGKLAGDKLTFDITIPYGPTIAFEFTLSGKTMSGTATFAGRKLKLAAKRP